MTKLFGEIPEQNALFEEWILKYSNLPVDNKDQILNVLMNVLDGTPMEYAINTGSLPYELVINVANTEKVIAFAWSPNFSEDEQSIESITVSANDITEQKQLEADRDNAREWASRLLELVSAEKSRSVKFINSTYLELNRLLTNNTLTISKSNIDEIFCTVHGIKGTARYLNLTRISNAAHTFEKQLDVQRRLEVISATPKTLNDGLNELLVYVTEYKSILEKDLSWVIGSDDQVEIESHLLQELFIASPTLCYNLSASYGKNSGLVAKLDAVLPTVSKIASDVLRGYIATCMRLEKLMPTLNMSGSSLRLYPSANKALLSSLTHLINNSLDHGIEVPKFRVDIGKPASGNLNVAIEKVESRYLINWRDDGQGLDLGKVAAKAESMGISTSGLTDAQTANLILSPGFTTKESVSDISGHGVGLHAVVLEFRAIGGDVEIKVGDQKSHRTYDFWIEISIPDIHAFIDFNEDALSSVCSAA